MKLYKLDDLNKFEDYSMASSISTLWFCGLHRALMLSYCSEKKGQGVHITKKLMAELDARAHKKAEKIVKEIMTSKGDAAGVVINYYKKEYIALHTLGFISPPSGDVARLEDWLAAAENVARKFHHLSKNEPSSTLQSDTIN